jgi:hypothetical protein
LRNSEVRKLKPVSREECAPDQRRKCCDFRHAFQRASAELGMIDYQKEDEWLTRMVLSHATCAKWGEEFVVTEFVAGR